MATESKWNSPEEKLLYRARWGLLDKDLNGDADAEQFTKWLKESGVDVNCVDKYGRTSLHIASKRDQKDVVTILLGEKDKIKHDVTDERGNTAIMEAAQKGHSDVVNLLIEAKADLTLENNFGFTADIMAQKAGHKSIADKLVESGAYD